jgi:glycosyltransferase involved in cell wall biosynthesis
MFADKYLERNQFISRITELPHPGTGIIVVIPCFREPDIILTLNSLAQCAKPKFLTEVLVLVNHSEAASDEIKAFNQTTRQELDSWIRNTPVDGMKFFAVGPVELKKKWAGVGMARKAGMDEAISRFNLLNKPEGIVVSLDADTLVEDNYLPEIEKFFKTHPTYAGATIAFSHQMDHLDNKQLQGINLYERYMGYYKKAMGFTGYPYPMYTVGSAITVTASAYVKRGGMNRRQAGEDFYFLQNLVQVGPVGEINDTVVHPSARISTRVPFGTGMVMNKWMRDEDDISSTYHFQAFLDLKKFFDLVPSLFRIEEHKYNEILSTLPAAVEAFLKEDLFYTELADLNNNCSSVHSFRNRFYHRFNAFRILKFLNFTHGKFYSRADLEQQMKHLEQYI